MARKKTRTSSIQDLREALAHRPLAYDLFAGVGGMSLGLEQAGFDVGVAVELEKRNGAYAQFNLPSTKVFFGPDEGDVRRVTAERLRKARPDRNHADIALISGGPPCQGFSLAGRMDTRDRLNGLVTRFASVVVEVGPMAFCLENVPGLSRGNTTTLSRALRRLRTEYHVTDVETLWAHDFGVPQARERVFVIGIRKDLNILPSLPEPTHAGTRKGAQRKQSVTVRDAILDLPDVAKLTADAWTAPYDQEPTSTFARRMRALVRSPDDYSVAVAWDRDVCMNTAPTVHGSAVLNRFKRLRPGDADSVSGVSRLSLDDVATTIRAGTTAERGSRSAPRPVHPLHPRVLTTRECARLQTFPDWFEFHPTRWHGNLQVGNAVPPLLARNVGLHIMTLLGLEPARIESLEPVTRDRTVLAGTQST